MSRYKTDWDVEVVREKGKKKVFLTISNNKGRTLKVRIPDNEKIYLVRSLMTEMESMKYFSRRIHI